MKSEERIWYKETWGRVSPDTAGRVHGVFPIESGPGSPGPSSPGPSSPRVRVHLPLGFPNQRRHIIIAKYRYKFHPNQI